MKQVSVWFLLVGILQGTEVFAQAPYFEGKTSGSWSAIPPAAPMINGERVGGLGG